MLNLQKALILYIWEHPVMRQWSANIRNYKIQAENNRSYTRPKYQIEQEKFEERIVVYPKDNCRVS